MESYDLLKVIKKAIDDKKGEDIKILNIEKLSVICDYFVITHGYNQPQVEAITDSIIDELGKIGVLPKRIEGQKNSGWILIDYGDIVVHVFMNDQRSFYELERIWKDAENVYFD
ncbi:MAG: ribosome silencing factor [Lachnospiraceae bacterium]|nr:ribosome silencing factor [Lachnospiraceae bacterium]